ncbi:MAG: DUF924 family protein [Rhodospirillales bacterium]
MSTKADTQRLTGQVLDFWFADPDGTSPAAQRPFWFKSTAEIDAGIRERFQDTLEQAAAGTFDPDIETADDHLAIILILDQFPRHMFRGTARAFATDPLARHWAGKAIARGLDHKQAAPYRRMFFYLPFEHSETLADQNEAVRLFEKMGYDDLTAMSRAHREVIEKYGRFPHRNAALERVSTPDEEIYLSRPGAGF